VLIELEKIALEVGLPETEVRNLATYAGVRREHSFYDDREILKMLVRHFREELFGCAAADYAEPRRVEKFTRPRVGEPRRPRQRKSPRSGNLITR